MKYVKKYERFLEALLAAEPKAKSGELKHKGAEMSEVDVVSRFSRLYKNLGSAEKTEFDSFF